MSGSARPGLNPQDIAVVKGGYIDLPTGPGLGIELDEQQMADKIGHKWRNRET